MNGKQHQGQITFYRLSQQLSRISFKISSCKQHRQEQENVTKVLCINSPRLFYMITKFTSTEPCVGMKEKID